MFWGLIKKGREELGKSKAAARHLSPSPLLLSPPPPPTPSASETSFWWEWGQFSKQGICTLRIYGHLCEGCGKPQDRRVECSFESIHFSQRFVEKTLFISKPTYHFVECVIGIDS